MRRLLAVSAPLLIVAMWIVASAPWATCTIADTSEVVSRSAIDGYPQLSLIFIVWLLVFFVARYTQSLFGRFILTAILVLLFSTAAPVWFESASGSLEILRPLILKKTGIGDWAGQQDLISNGVYNHLNADLFVILLIVALSTSVIQVWFAPAKQKGFTNLTRIDRLPRW